MGGRGAVNPCGHGLRPDRGCATQTAFDAAPIGLLAFAIFGTSRQLVVAVSAITTTMSFATVSLIAMPTTTEFILLSAALGVLAGLISILTGMLKLGWVAQFFTESVGEVIIAQSQILAYSSS